MTSLDCPAQVKPASNEPRCALGLGSAPGAPPREDHQPEAQERASAWLGNDSDADRRGVQRGLLDRGGGAGLTEGGQVVVHREKGFGGIGNHGSDIDRHVARPEAEARVRDQIEHETGREDPSERDDDRGDWAGKRLEHGHETPETDTGRRSIRPDAREVGLAELADDDRVDGSEGRAVDSVPIETVVKFAATATAGPLEDPQGERFVL